MDKVFMAPDNLSDLQVVEELPMPSVPIIHVVSPLVLHVKEGETLTLMDKKNSHSLLDMMILQTGDTPKATIEHLTPEEYRLTFSLVAHYADFINREEIIHRFGMEGSLPRFSFNHDPFTNDRESLQATRRFHLHMYLLESNMLEEIQERKRRYGQIENKFERQRLVDPMSFLSAHLIYDLITYHLPQNEFFTVMYPDGEEAVRTGRSLGLNIRLNEGWEVLKDEGFSNYFLNVHHAILFATEQVYFAMTGRDSVPPLGHRHQLLEIETIQENLRKLIWLSDFSRDGLLEMARTLRPVSRLVSEINKRHPEWAVYHVVAKSLPYTVSIAPEYPIGAGVTDNPLYLNLSLRLFSDVGGAGLFGCLNTSAVKLKRGDGVFSELELKRRWDFQKEFFRFVEKGLKDLYETSRLTAEQVIPLIR